MRKEPHTYGCAFSNGSSLTATFDPAKAIKGRLSQIDFEWSTGATLPPFAEYKAWITSVMSEVAKRERFTVALLLLGPNEMVIAKEDGTVIAEKLKL